MSCKLILECGCNHNGNLNTARDMICAAFHLGAWGVKFQKRDIDSIPDEMKNQKRKPANSFGKTYYEHRAALEFNIADMLELRMQADDLGLKFLCSAFDLKSVIDLTDIGVKYIKIPSQYAGNDEMILAARMSCEKVFISTGMRSREEIDKLCWLNEDLSGVVPMHCISVYPSQLSQSNLITLSDMADKYGEVGYSSHDVYGLAVKYAVIAGAKYIERHFTLDKSMKGSDHSTVSSDPSEIKRIVYDIKQSDLVLGDKERKVSYDEQIVRDIYLRGKNV